MPALFDHHDRKKNRFWNTAPVNPLKLAQASGTPYLTGKPLMPESPMPVGEHVGKTMRQVPVAYLRWVNAQPWAKTWRHWAPVADYLERFPLAEKTVAEGAARVEMVDVGSSQPRSTTVNDRQPPSTAPLCLFVDTLTACAPSPAWRFPSFCRLYCTREDWEPMLHALALGALGLEKRFYQRGGLAHYRLNEAGQERALGAGVELADRAMAARHEWLAQREPFVREMPDGTRRCTKACYGSLKEAQTIINERTKGRKAYRHNRPVFLRAYPCPHCGFYHLTSKP